MSVDFYDKVAGKFGKYSTGVETVDEFPNGKPEEEFKGQLMKYSGKDKVCLDVGCADGRFSISVAPFLQTVYAIDTSLGMLSSATSLQKKTGVKNIILEKKDAHNTGYQNDFFDIVYSRRGPTDYQELRRILRKDGVYLEIQIGEKDTQQLKEVFGRGQNFGKWEESTLERNKNMLVKEGFEITFSKDYLYNEYYSSYQDLDKFLQGVPIFEDFDSEKDKKLLSEYISKFTSEKGIRLPRHRIVTVAKTTS